MSEQLFPTPETYTLADGREVILHKTKAKYVARVAQFVAKIVNDLAAVPGATLGVEFMDASNNGSILHLISKYAEELPEYVAMHCSLTKEEVDELDADDYVVLMIKIVNYNKRFFSERVAPLLAATTA